MRVKPYLVIRTFKKMGSAQDAAKELGVHRSTVYRWILKARTAFGTLSEERIKKKTHKTT